MWSSPKSEVDPVTVTLISLLFSFWPGVTVAQQLKPIRRDELGVKVADTTIRKRIGQCHFEFFWGVRFLRSTWYSS